MLVLAYVIIDITMRCPVLVIRNCSHSQRSLPVKYY